MSTDPLPTAVHAYLSEQGRKGGRARASALTSETARRASLARWAKPDAHAKVATYWTPARRAEQARVMQRRMLARAREARHEVARTLMKGAMEKALGATPTGGQS